MAGPPGIISNEVRTSLQAILEVRTSKFAFLENLLNKSANQRYEQRD